MIQKPPPSRSRDGDDLALWGLSAFFSFSMRLALDLSEAQLHSIAELTGLIPKSAANSVALVVDPSSTSTSSSKTSGLTPNLTVQWSSFLRIFWLGSEERFNRGGLAPEISKCLIGAQPKHDPDRLFIGEMIP